MNKRAKGMRVERELQKLFEMVGYEVYRPAWGRTAKAKDIFGKFDIIAVAKSNYDMVKAYTLCGGYSIVFAQVKSNKTDFYKAKKQIQKWIKSVRLSENRKAAALVYLRQPRKKWKTWLANKDLDWEFTTKALIAQTTPI